MKIDIEQARSDFELRMSLIDQLQETLTTRPDTTILRLWLHQVDSLYEQLDDAAVAMLSPDLCAALEGCSTACQRLALLEERIAEWKKA